MIRLLAVLLLLPAAVSAQSVSGVTGTLEQDATITIAGSSFGSKSTANPCIWETHEDGTLDTAADIGTWHSWTHLTLSASQQRHSNSTYNGGINFDGGAGASYGSRTGGASTPDGSTWYIQYWFYLASDFAFDGDQDNNLGNIKLFRLWSSGSDINNLRIQFRARYDSDLVVEAADEGHDWEPVTPGDNWIDEIMGWGDPGEISGGWLGWKHYEVDVSTGSWHCFQFQYEESAIDTYDGQLKWWFDGTLILDVDDVRTRTSASNANSSMRPHTVGFYNSHTDNPDGDNHFYIDDMYIDDTWARVEVGDSATYAACTQREIQVCDAWSATSITLDDFNQGSYELDDPVYFYVTDSDGNTSAAYGPLDIEGEGGGPPAGITAVDSLWAVDQ